MNNEKYFCVALVFLVLSACANDAKHGRMDVLMKFPEIPEREKVRN